MTKEGGCPSCGRFVGPKGVCPYCGVRIGKRISLQLTKILSIVGAFVGLGVLYTLSFISEIPSVPIEKISPAMNFATVRITGVAARDSYRREGYLAFSLSDGTGEIWIRGYREIDTIPVYGDTVEVIGSIQVREERASLIIQRLWVGPMIEIRDISSISESDVGSIVRIKGWIDSFRHLKRGIVIRVRDGTGEIETVIWEREFSPSVGREIECIGKVRLFRGETQITIGRIL